MMALFDTAEEYAVKNAEISLYFGYPNKAGTLRYASENPQQDSNGKYYMRVSSHIAHLFADCTIVSTVELPQEVENDY